jgi:DNA polymerase I-like protein with 3'-5' exonuclease and polymerase domains
VEAGVYKLAMYFFYQEIKGGLKAWFIHMLHDELIVECSRANSKRVAKILVDCMNRACTAILGEPLSVPELKITDHWDKRKNI